MAEEGAIDRPDIITDRAIKAPLELVGALKTLDKGFDTTIENCQELQKVVENTTSMKKLQDSIGKLIQENKLLTKTQDDLFKRMDKLEKENKELTKSLKDVQQQTKRNREETEKLGNAVSGLDNRLGGTITRYKQLGKELWAIAKHPVVLTIGILVGLFAALASTVKTFFTATGEGEDILARQTAIWNQFFASVKKGWADLGKEVVEFLGEGGMKKVVNFLFDWAKVILAIPSLILPIKKIIQEMQDSFNKTADEAENLADVMDDIETRMSLNIVRKANTEKQYNELILASQDKLMHSDIDRLLLMQKGIKVKEDQLKVDRSLAQEYADALLLQIGLEHSLTEAQVRRMDFKAMDKEFTAEEIKRIMEARAAVINLEATYAAEVKRNSAKIIALKQEMHDKEVALAKKAAEEILKVGQDAVDKEDYRLRREVANAQAQTTELLKNESLGWRERKKIIEDNEELIKQMREQFRIEEINNQIKALEVSFKLLDFDADEQAKVAERLKELKLKLINEVYEASKTLGKTQLDVDRENIQKTKEMYEEFASSIGSLFSSLSENKLSNIDREEKALEDSLDRQLNMAGDNAERKKEIENEGEKRRRDLERKRIQEQRKAAIFDKVTSLIQAGINGALAVTNQLAKGDPYTAFARAAAAGIAAAIQVAAIASKQIPQYFKGGKTSAPIIIAGEQGIEHYRTPSGKEGFTPGRATLMNLPVGTVIKDHKSTMAMIAKKGIREDTLGKKSDVDYVDVLANKMDTLNHTMATRSMVQVNYTSKGVEGLLIKGLNKIKFNGGLFR